MGNFNMNMNLNLIDDNGLRISSQTTYVKLPEAFAKHFGINAYDQNIEQQIITLEKFDDWAINCGLYRGYSADDNNSLNTVRNRLRSAINNICRGNEWRDEYYSFQIKVGDHGKTLKVCSAVESFLGAWDDLPAKVKKISERRREQVEQLLDSINPNELELEHRLAAKQMLRDIQNTMRVANLQFSILEDNFRSFRNDIVKYLPNSSVLNDYDDDQEDLPLLSVRK